MPDLNTYTQPEAHAILRSKMAAHAMTLAKSVLVTLPTNAHRIPVHHTSPYDITVSRLPRALIAHCNALGVRLPIYNGPISLKISWPVTYDGMTHGEAITYLLAYNQMAHARTYRAYKILKQYSWRYVRRRHTGIIKGTKPPKYSPEDVEHARLTSQLANYETNRAQHAYDAYKRDPIGYWIIPHKQAKELANISARLAAQWRSYKQLAEETRATEAAAAKYAEDREARAWQIRALFAKCRQADDSDKEAIKAEISHLLYGPPFQCTILTNH